MDVQINLYRDMVDLVNAEIVNLKRQGFTFEEYAEWENRRKEHLSKRRQRCIADDRDTSQIDVLCNPRRLLADFKIHQAFHYLDLQYRIPDPHPRKIRYTSQFKCPDIRKKGLQMLEQDIERGKSLFPRLSREIFNATKQDGMLFDWGIIHFHLGTVDDKKYPMLIEGHSEILYAMLDEEFAYFLTVDKHGRWADKELLRLVKNEFPHLIENYQISGFIELVTQPTAKEHVSLRKAGVSVITEIDGVCYMSPGGGVNTAGGSMQSTLRLQQIAHWYRQAEKIIKDHLIELAETDERFPLNKNDRISFRMSKLSNDSITVTDLKLKLKVVLTYTPDRKGFDLIRVDFENGT